MLDARTNFVSSSLKSLLILHLVSGLGSVRHACLSEMSLRRRFWEKSSINELRKMHNLKCYEVKVCIKPQSNAIFAILKSYRHLWCL